MFAYKTLTPADMQECGVTLDEAMFELSFSTFSPDLREVLPAGILLYSTHSTLPLANAVRQLQHVYMYYISLKFELAEHILYISCT